MHQLETERLLLRPVCHSDAADLERFIFSEPEIVKALAHNGASAERRHYHASEWSGFGPDGNHDFWEACKMGLYVIHDRSGSIASPDRFLGVCGVFLEREENHWCGELFYALARPFHGKGIMSEAAIAVLRRFDQIDDAGYLYAVYWQLLNPASGRVLEKIGFDSAGTRDLLDEYSQALYQGVREFELWRLGVAAAENQRAVLKEVAIKLGHFERENIVTRQANRQALQSALREQSLGQRVVDWLDQGAATPGFGLLIYRAGN